MRKFLALVLALVMTMSLVTVSAGAATDFADDADITSVEAVEVLNAMGVLTGNNGKFNPNGKLTRGAGAKIVAYLMLGQKAADKLQATYTVFSDVTESVGLAAYIEWAEARGIVGGYGDGTFGPYDTLTEYAFGKMLLAALGYKAAEEGYTGAGWQKNVYADALAAGIYNGTETYGACIRDTAARMALGALKANIVYYGSAVTDDAYMWNGHKLEGVESTTSVVGAIESATPMWKLYDKLTYTPFGLDIYGRPGHKWVYGKTFSKFYMETPVAEYTTGAAICDVLVDMGLSKSSKAEVEAYYYKNGKLEAVDASELSHGDDCVDTTKVYGTQGVLTQVFELKNDQFIITEVDTYLAKVTSVKKTIHNTTGNTELTVYANTDWALDAPAFAGNTELEEVVAAGNIGFAKGEYVLIGMSETATYPDKDTVYNDENIPAFMQTLDADGEVDIAVTDDYKTALVNLDAGEHSAQLNTDDFDEYTFVTVVGAPKVLSNAKFSGMSVSKGTATINGVQTPVAKHYELTVCDLDAKANAGKYNFFADQYDNIIGDLPVTLAYTFGVIESAEWYQTPGTKVPDYVEGYVVNGDATVNRLETYKYNGINVANAEDGLGTPSADETVAPTFSQVYTKNTAYTAHDTDGAGANENAFGVVKVFALEDGGYDLKSVTALEAADGGEDVIKVVVNGDSFADTDNDNDGVITNGHPILNGADPDESAEADEETIFVVKTLDAKGNPVYASYTGIQNVPSMGGARFVAVYEDPTASQDFNAADFVYVDLSNGYFVGKDDIALFTDLEAYYIEIGEEAGYYAWINGQKVTVYYGDDDLFDTSSDKTGFYMLHYDAEGYVTDAEFLAEVTPEVGLSDGTEITDGTQMLTLAVTGITGKVIGSAGSKLHLAADTQIFVVNYLDVADGTTEGVWGDAEGEKVLSVEAGDADDLFVGAELLYVLKAGSTDNLATVFVMVPHTNA